MEGGDRGQEMAPRLCIFNSDASEEERWTPRVGIVPIDLELNQN